MIKSGTLKPALLLALIAVIVIALAEPIAGHMMGQGNMMGQRSMMIVCPDNQTCTMMQSNMGDHQANETMMPCMMGHHGMMGHRGMMGNDSMNETMMPCMMGNYSMNETMMHRMPCMMGDHAANKTMIHCMMRGNHPMKGSCCIMGMDKNASAAQAKLDCAQFWLEQAIELHEMHLKDPSAATNQSQLEMMDQMMRAYECIVGENMTENVTMGITNKTAGPGSEGY